MTRFEMELLAVNFEQDATQKRIANALERLVTCLEKMTFKAEEPNPSEEETGERPLQDGGGAAGPP